MRPWACDVYECHSGAPVLFFLFILFWVFVLVSKIKGE